MNPRMNHAWTAALMSLALLWAGVACADRAVPLPTWPTPPPAPSDALVVLAYHDVVPDADRGNDGTSITPDALIRQFEWMKAHGYHFVSWAQVRDARNGQPTLPPKAVLVTFDDGLKSVYTNVLPLLKAYQVPAVVSVVDAWMNLKPGQTLPYNGRTCTSACFITWDELREMDRSGWVTVGSHTDDLHHGAIANAAGNEEPAAAYRLYHQTWESQEQYIARVRADLEKSDATLRRELGHGVEVIAWPYGAYNRTTEDLARERGWTSLGLSANGPTSVHAPALERVLVGNDMHGDDLARAMDPPNRPLGERALVVDAAPLWAATPAEREVRLGKAVDRLADLDPSEVWVRLPEGHAPFDWNRMVWQWRTRSHVRVWALVPASASPATVEALGTAAAWDGLVLQGEASLAQQQALKDAWQRSRPDLPVRLWAALGTARAAGVQAVCAGQGPTPPACPTDGVWVWQQALQAPQATHAIEHWVAKGVSRWAIDGPDWWAEGTAWKAWLPVVSTRSVPETNP